MTSNNVCHCEVVDTDPRLYRWRPCPLHGLARQPPALSSFPQSIGRLAGPPSLSYSRSSIGSDSTKSSPPTPPPTAPHSFDARDYAQQVQERYRPKCSRNPVDISTAGSGTTDKSRAHTPSVYEPQARKPGHRVYVLARDRNKLPGVSDKPLVRCQPTDKMIKQIYYAQRTGSNPTQESLLPNILSCWGAGPRFCFEPHGLAKASKRINRDRKKTWFAPDPIHDPRDPIIEQTSQRTIQRHQPIRRPGPRYLSKPSGVPKSIKPDRLEELEVKEKV
ncbi:hypothetical protein F5876DRAFT_61421 [Lentinula aff. lateritia]|uniref:Uncharacterized protein n=1 Tax=Lentinula aff. lateritia TaxID=2804960 RepID=A0ACC1UF54_9AGAR|nr:hypothetical protein F5876DRAFT_61421 [Lentinula aff. lateritia]